MRASDGSTPPAGRLELAEPGEIDAAVAYARHRDHVLAYRASLPVAGRRYYIAFFCGREGRSAERLVRDGQCKSWRHTMASATGVGLVACTLLMSGLATAYLGKSMLGIDLFEDHFILHNLFFD